MTHQSASRCCLLDLDGVVWLADEPIDGAAGAVTGLRRAGWRVAFFSNNSYPLHQRHLDKLCRFGIEVAPEDLLTSAQAAAECCEPGETALVLGGAGIVEALEARGVAATRIGDELEPERSGALAVDVVVAGIDPELTYRRLAVAATAIRSGARFVGTNDDATFPSPDGPRPGAGSVLAALATAAGREPSVAGKPNQPAADLAHRRLGAVTIVVGDRPSTDGLLARRMGARFGLVLTGVTPAGHGRLEVTPEIEAEDLARLVDRLLADDRAP